MPIINEKEFSPFGKLKFFIPEGSIYAKFQHESKPATYHFFFYLGSDEYKFTLSKCSYEDSIENVIQHLYMLVKPFSVPEYSVDPYLVQSETCSGWAYEYSLLKDKELRICKVVLESPIKYLCLTYSAAPEAYEEGLQVFEKTVRSFSLVDVDSVTEA
ncbi:MAG TPA: hypothetical protein PLI60_03470 [Anaerolineaceae bacterium]|nr:hypothetical protein [Anaerolineaceae bacterium]HPC05756.1 hypothetical protein [Anaerolineaceae bacterium]HQP09380.1 hypothetical protein [Anaerolineaceae bacterium]